jgi:hypothetical protein
LLTFTLSATDADLPANTLTFSATGLPAGATFDPATRVFAWTPTEAQGPNVFSGVVFAVSDGTTTTSETITVTVNEVNQAPVLTAIGNKSVNEGSLLTFTLSATDADLPANTLTFSASTLPAGATLNPSTGVFVWTPTDAQGPGTFNVTLQVSDGQATVNEAITINVNSVTGITLDVDGNGVADALSDGILIIRYLFGFTGNALVNGVVDLNGTRNTAPLVESYLTQAVPVMLDVDGNGTADALSDGIVIIRYLFGFTGDALINGVVDPAGTRHTAASVEAFLQGFLPISASAAGLAAESAGTDAGDTTTSSGATASVSSAVMVSDMEEPTTDLSLAYVQQSWVKNYVAGDVSVADASDEEELLIALPG